VSILDDIAAQAAAITQTADGYISDGQAVRAAKLKEATDLDAALASLETAIAAERAKLAPAISAWTALSLVSAPAAA